MTDRLCASTHIWTTLATRKEIKLAKERGKCKDHFPNVPLTLDFNSRLGELPAILPPSRPPTAFGHFMKQFYKDWQTEGRGSFSEVGLAWRRLSEEEKKVLLNSIFSQNIDWRLKKYYDPAEWEEYRRKMDEYLRATISSTDGTRKTTPYIL